MALLQQDRYVGTYVTERASTKEVTVPGSNVQRTEITSVKPPWGLYDVGDLCDLNQTNRVMNAKRFNEDVRVTGYIRSRFWESESSIRNSADSA